MQNQPQQGEPSPAWGDDQQQSQPHTPTVWEWAAAALGLLLVGGALGFLFYQALTGYEAPPDVRVQVLDVHQVGHGYLVEIRVRNYGNTTAAELTIEGELRQGDEPLETSHSTFDYVPARSQRTGGLFFTRDPRQFRLELGPKGYQKP
jgi:uncharacterized protein (TIGR02588 family)